MQSKGYANHCSLCDSSSGKNVRTNNGGARGEWCKVITRTEIIQNFKKRTASNIANMNKNVPKRPNTTLNKYFPQQRNSSGVHRCRHRVRFNEVRRRFRRFPRRSGIWCRERSGSTGFRKSREGSRKPGCKAKSGSTGSTGFRRRFRRRSGRFCAEPGQVQQGSGEGCWEGPGEGFGNLLCRARSVQHGFGKGSGEGLGGFGAEPEKVWEALVRSQVRFNKVPEKVPEKVPAGFGAEPGQVQQGSGERSGEGRKPWCKAKSGSTGLGEGCWEGPGEGFGNLRCRARSGSNRFKGFPALGFAARFRKICKHKPLRLLGIRPKLMFFVKW